MIAQSAPMAAPRIERVKLFASSAVKDLSPVLINQLATVLVPSAPGKCPLTHASARLDMSQRLLRRNRRLRLKIWTVALFSVLPVHLINLSTTIISALRSPLAEAQNIAMAKAAHTMRLLRTASVIM